MKTLHRDSSLIDRLGGTMAVAKMFGIKSPSVSEWRRGGIPKSRLMFLKLARPELFADSPAEDHRHA